MARSWWPCRCRRTTQRRCATSSRPSSSIEELRKQRRRLRRTYLGYLLLLTVGVLFASTWLALYLSKMVTRPLLALAEATQEISRGHLDYRVDVQVGSEIGQLVNSFNQMAADLEASRASIEASRADLADVNVQLEQRNRHIETILESIPTGVLSLDASRHVVHMNGAVQRLLHLEPAPAQPDRTLGELFPEEVTADLEHLLRKADRMGTTTSQMEIVTSRVNLNVAVTVASLDSPAPRAGPVGAAHGIRGGAGRHHRPAARAETDGLERSGAPRGPRNQEPAHSHRACRPSAFAATWSAARRPTRHR